MMYEAKMCLEQAILMHSFSLIVVADLPSKVFCRLMHHSNQILSNLIVYSLKCTTNRHRFNTDENTDTWKYPGIEGDGYMLIRRNQ